jgi:TetR/AcrR family transcriptional regulator, transcriptional repressor of bet genes
LLALRVGRRYGREVERTIIELAKEHGIPAADAKVMGTSLTAMIDGLSLQFMLSPRAADRRYAIRTCMKMIGQWFPRFSEAA